MAKKKETSIFGSIFLAILMFVGIIQEYGVYISISIASLILMFFVMFYFAFRKLQIKYLDSPTAIRVMDIKKCLPFLGVIGGLFIVLLFSPFAVLGIEEVWLKYLVSVVLVIVFVGGEFIAAKHLAVLYLGIVVDKEHDYVVLPFDMESYTISDYLSLQFIRDFCDVDSIALSEIDRLSRGRGVELYIHGSFGSRGLLSSSKQKRDEALSIIKELNSSNTKMLSEIESY